VELDRSAPSHLYYLDLQTSLRLGHTQSCQGKAPGSHPLHALVDVWGRQAIAYRICNFRDKRWIVELTFSLSTVDLEKWG
jgi:hypothetical protein